MPNQLIKLIISDNLNTIVDDLEQTLNYTFINNDFLKGIPYYGSYLRVKEKTTTIQDQIFSIKILSFLRAISTSSYLERYDRINEIIVDDQYKYIIGRKLLFIIDNCEDDEKAVIIGLLFKNFIESLMSYEQFLNFAHSIRNISIPEIKYLIKNENLHSGTYSTNPLNSNIFLNEEFMKFKIGKKIICENDSYIESSYTLSLLAIKLKEILKNHFVD